MAAANRQGHRGVELDGDAMLKSTMYFEDSIESISASIAYEMSMDPKK